MYTQFRMVVNPYFFILAICASPAAVRPNILAILVFRISDSRISTVGVVSCISIRYYELLIFRISGGVREIRSV